MRAALTTLAVLVAAVAGLFAAQRLLPPTALEDGCDPAVSVEIPPAPALTPEQELATFVVEPGFRVELVAADPLIEDPVSIRFDEHGRMWVVEMRGFMPDPDGDGEGAPVGRIAVLEDTDRDGLMDKRTTFLDGLVLPRAVLPLGDGEALVLVPPHFVHAKDGDGDLVADERVDLTLQFPSGVVDPEYAANSPAFGLDGWIYLAHFNQRLRHRDGVWQSEPVAFGGQWGLSMDDRGVWYVSVNDDYLRAHVAPPHYEARHPHLDRPEFVNQAVALSQEVWPVRVTPGVNRGYRPGILRADGRLRAFTAAAAPLVYRANLMPALRGDVFVAEPGAHVIRRAVIEERGTTLRGANAYAQREFLASRDERFRPVDLQLGPDGAIYVVDMYRGLIQHRRFLSAYLRCQVETRGLATPIHRGRIWRIVPARDDGSERTWTVPADASSWARLLVHDNGWVRDTAQRLLVNNPDRARDELPELRGLARSNEAALARLHALWTLEGVGALDETTLSQALRAPDPAVREQAVRLAEGRLAVPVATGLLDALARMAAEESDARVSMQLAFTLGAVDRGDEIARERAVSALLELLSRSEGDARLRDAVLSGVAGEEVELVVRLATDPRWAEASEERERTLARIAECVVSSREESAMHALFSAVAAEKSAWRRRALLDGAAAALPRVGTRRISLARRPEALTGLAKSSDRAVAKHAARIEDAIEIGGATTVPPLSPDEQVLLERGESAYGLYCAPCHQVHGRGIEGLAPPLAGSEWVLDAPERPVRIVLHGLTGPIDVAGRRYDFALMPDHSALDDEEVAAILTYVRRAWGNLSGPVTPSFVSFVREEDRSRKRPWTAAELLASQPLGVQP